MADCAPISAGSPIFCIKALLRSLLRLIAPPFPRVTPFSIANIKYNPAFNQAFRVYTQLTDTDNSPALFLFLSFSLSPPPSLFLSLSLCTHLREVVVRLRAVDHRVRLMLLLMQQQQLLQGMSVD